MGAPRVEAVGVGHDFDRASQLGGDRLGDAGVGEGPSDGSAEIFDPDCAGHPECVGK